MPSRSELPGDLARKKLLTALIRLGFEINTVGGKGSCKDYLASNTEINNYGYGYTKRCSLLSPKRN